MIVGQILRDAEKLKVVITENVGKEEALVARQSIQNLYQKIMFIDLEYALDKKMEQDLWNYAFKNQITLLQQQAKEEKGLQRSEFQSQLSIFLEAASGFYLQLLQEICSVYQIDLPFRRKTTYLGIVKDHSSSGKIKMPKTSSCLYVCQHCLVHLGDIARYKQQSMQAQSYYRHAAVVVPFNGQPYNQLAILEVAKANRLGAAFYYLRSITVKHYFPVAITNLSKFYMKVSKEKIPPGNKVQLNDVITTLLQFFSLNFLHSDLKKTQALMGILLTTLPTHIGSISLSPNQISQIAAISLFTLYYTKGKMNKAADTSKKGSDVKESEQLTNKYAKHYDVIMKFLIYFFDILLSYTPKNEQRTREYNTLPAIKLLLDWIRASPELLTRIDTQCPMVWSYLSKIFNNIQSPARDGSFNPAKCSNIPLPEDFEVQCFAPLQKVHTDFDFKQSIESLSTEQEQLLRCHRLIAYGHWICEEMPSLNLMNHQKLKSGKVQFTVPNAKIMGKQGRSTLTPEDRSSKQNVAIQAIMQKQPKVIIAKPPQPTEPPPIHSQCDAGVMVHGIDTSKPPPIPDTSKPPPANELPKPGFFDLSTPPPPVPLIPSQPPFGSYGMMAPSMPPPAFSNQAENKKLISDKISFNIDTSENNEPWPISRLTSDNLAPSGFETPENQLVKDLLFNVKDARGQEENVHQYLDKAFNGNTKEMSSPMDEFHQSNQRGNPPINYNIPIGSVSYNPHAPPPKFSDVNPMLGGQTNSTQSYSLFNQTPWNIPAPTDAGRQRVPRMPQVGLQSQHSSRHPAGQYQENPEMLAGNSFQDQSKALWGDQQQTAIVQLLHLQQKRQVTPDT